MSRKTKRKSPGRKKAKSINKGRGIKSSKKRKKRRYVIVVNPVLQRYLSEGE